MKASEIHGSFEEWHIPLADRPRFVGDCPAKRVRAEIQMKEVFFIHIYIYIYTYIIYIFVLYILAQTRGTSGS